MKAQRYSCSWFYASIYFLMGVLFIASGLYGASSRSLDIGTLVLMGLGALLVTWSLSLIQTVSIDAAGVEYRSAFKSTKMHWNETVVFVPKFGNSFQLRDQSASKIVHISSQLGGFGELVAAIRENSPAFQNLNNIQVFHLQKWVPVFQILLALFLLQKGLDGLARESTSNIDGLLILGALVLGLHCLQLPLRVTLTGSEMQVKTLVAEKKYQRTEVKDIDLVSIWIRGFNSVYARINLGNKKFVPFSNLQEGTVVFVEMIRKWLSQKE